MEQIFSVGIGPHKNFRQHRQTIDLISQAIDKRRTAQMRYFSASRDSTGRREVDPYFLRFVGGGLYLIGHWYLSLSASAIQAVQQQGAAYREPPLNHRRGCL